MEITAQHIGHYIRVLAGMLNTFVFVLDVNSANGMVQVRHMDGSTGWGFNSAFAPVTEDEELAAAIEWGLASGQLVDAADWMAQVDADESAEVPSFAEWRRNNSGTLADYRAVYGITDNTPSRKGVTPHFEAVPVSGWQMDHADTLSRAAVTLDAGRAMLASMYGDAIAEHAVLMTIAGEDFHGHAVVHVDANGMKTKPRYMVALATGSLSSVLVKVHEIS